MTIPERWLHWSWLLPGHLKEPLHAIDGRPIEIVQRGQLNLDNGPDIVQARLRIGNCLYQGDVEFHLTPRDWFQHGHHHDRRYAGVILHGVWQAPEDLPRPLARRMAHVVLAQQIALPYPQWVQAMQRLEEQPEALGPSLPHGVLSLNALSQLSFQRLHRKMAWFASRLNQSNGERLLWLGLAEALGYARNRLPMSKLIDQIDLAALSREIPACVPPALPIWLYLLLRGGLWPACPSPGLQKAEELCRWADYFRQRGVVPVLQLTDWHFSRLRPGNHPVVRLAALAQWLSCYGEQGLFARFWQLARERLPVATLLERWEGLLIQPFAPALRRGLAQLLHWQQVPHSTVGRERARQILLNVVLPLFILWAARSENFGFQLYLESAYESFPAVENAASLKKALQVCVPAALRSRVQRSGFLQQGLLEWLQTSQANQAQLPLPVFPAWQVHP